MATWREKFSELSAENGKQLDLWKSGQRNHGQVMGTGEAIGNFLRKYQASGEPDRDQEMPAH